MKIAGVVNNYNEALEIEEIVKVFIIEKKIFKLQPLNSKEKFEYVVKSKNNIFQANDVEYSEPYSKKNINIKNNDEFRPVFNVRGLV